MEETNFEPRLLRVSKCFVFPNKTYCKNELKLNSSCWAFATASIIDSAFQIQKNITLASSQQDMVDCSEYLGTFGCQGGSQANGNFPFVLLFYFKRELEYVKPFCLALEYAILNGTALESSYPYTLFNGAKVRVRILFHLILK